MYESYVWLIKLNGDFKPAAAHRVLRRFFRVPGVLVEQKLRLVSFSNEGIRSFCHTSPRATVCVFLSGKRAESGASVGLKKAGNTVAPPAPILHSRENFDAHAALGLPPTGIDSRVYLVGLPRAPSQKVSSPLAGQPCTRVANARLVQSSNL